MRRACSVDACAGRFGIGIGIAIGIGIGIGIVVEIGLPLRLEFETADPDPDPDGDWDLPVQETVEVAAEKIRDIPFNLRFRQDPTRIDEIGVLLREDAGDDLPRVPPLVDDLIQDTGVGVLRDMRQAQ